MMVHADKHAPEPSRSIGRKPHGAGHETAMLSGMREEFLDFYERERPLVERFLILLGAGRQDAEDGTHEAFAEAWRKITDGTWPQVASQRAWVRTVAYNAFRRPPRQRRSALDALKDPADLPGLGGLTPDHAELTAWALTVLGALRQLEDLQAGAVIALDLDGVPGDEIAVILGVGSQRVLDLRKKARAHLGRILAPATLAREGEAR